MELLDATRRGEPLQTHMLDDRAVLATTAEGRNALHLAAIHGRLWATWELCIAGCCPVELDNYGNKPADYAPPSSMISNILRTAAKAQPYVAVSAL